MSMPPPNMPLPPNEDRGDAAIAVFWTLTSIATVIVAARFYARWLIRGIGLDDWMILVSLGLFFITSGFVTHIAQLGGFRHLVYVPLQNGTKVAMSMLLAQVFNIIAFGTSKFAVGYQLLRVLDRTSVWRKSFVWVIVIVTLLYNVIEGVLTMFQCTPAKAAWDPMVKGECWNMHTKLVNIYVGGGYNIATDVILAVLPLPTIWELNLGLRDRVRLCILLGLGLFAAVCSSVKLSYANSISKLEDLTWGTYELDIWSGAELFVIIVCCSIPPLHVFWQRVIKESSLYARGSKLAYGNSGGSRDEKKNSHRYAIDPRARAVPLAGETLATEDDEAKLWPSPRLSPPVKHSPQFSVTRESELSNFGRGIAAVTEISVSSTHERSDAGSDRSSVPGTK